MSKKSTLWTPKSSHNIPLFTDMLGDPSISLTQRSVDYRWLYHGLIPTGKFNGAGFNPATGHIFYGMHSAFDSWLREKKSARDANFMDRLVTEYLFTAHDYLHAWSYRWIAELVPKSIGFGSSSVNRKNFEDFVFCHLVSEACATVGLDYWYLASSDLNAKLQIGTNVDTLTVSYHQRDDSEYKSLNRHFESQSPSFFSEIASFYLTGEFKGFDKRDIQRSAKVYRWLQHELTYGETQRVYSRLWFNQMLEPRSEVPADLLKRPLKIDSRWKKDLLRQLGDLLWEKVKSGKPHYLKRNFHAQRPAAKISAPDYRFNTFQTTYRTSGKISEYEQYQRLISRDFDSLDPDLRASVMPLVRMNERSVFEMLIKQTNPIRTIAKEKVPDIFFLP